MATTTTRADAPVLAHHQPTQLMNRELFHESRNKDSDVASAPSSVEFDGFQLNKPTKAIVNITNRGAKPLRTHIFPPESRNFVISYTKKGNFVPGATLPIEVTFQTNEMRYHTDAIRIQVEGSENLIIPLHAYPPMPELNVPRLISFGDVALGDEKERAFEVHNSTINDVSFRIGSKTSIDEDLEVEPRIHQLEPGASVTVTIRFRPSRYVTVGADLELALHSYRRKVFPITISARCKQGLAAARETLRLTQSQRTRSEGINVSTGSRGRLSTDDHSSATGAGQSDQSVQTPIDEQEQMATDQAAAEPADASLEAAQPGSSARPKNRKKTAQLTRKKPASKQKQHLKDIAEAVHGLQLPSSTSGMAAVNKVLNQHVTHLGSNRPSQLTRDVDSYQDSREAREEAFLQHLKLVRAQTPGLGLVNISGDERRHILALRREKLIEYNQMLGCGPDADEAACGRTATSVDIQPLRFIRKLADEPSDHTENLLKKVDFLPKPGLIMKRRIICFERFRAAVRKVILQQRAARRLAALRFRVRDRETSNTEASSSPDIDKESQTSIASLPEDLDWPFSLDKLSALSEPHEAVFPPMEQPEELKPLFDPPTEEPHLPVPAMDHLPRTWAFENVSFWDPSMASSAMTYNSSTLAYAPPESQLGFVANILRGPAYRPLAPASRRNTSSRPSSRSGSQPSSIRSKSPRAHRVSKHNMQPIKERRRSSSVSAIASARRTSIVSSKAPRSSSADMRRSSLAQHVSASNASGKNVRSRPRSTLLQHDKSARSKESEL